MGGLFKDLTMYCSGLKKKFEMCSNRLDRSASDDEHSTKLFGKCFGNTRLL